MKYTVYSAYDEEQETPLGTVETDEGNNITQTDDYGESAVMTNFIKTQSGRTLKMASSGYRSLFFIPEVDNAR